MTFYFSLFNTFLNIDSIIFNIRKVPTFIADTKIN